MKKNKGFTLIELLAVIVILAIIALIATPIILKLVNDARIGAFKDSIHGIVKSAEIERAKNLLSGMSTTTIVLSDLEYNGKKYTVGSINVNDAGKIEAYIWSEELEKCGYKAYDSENIVFDDTKDSSTCLSGPTFSGIDLTSSDPDYSCYTFDSGTGTITSYSYNDDCPSTFVAPTTIDGVNVVALGDYMLGSGNHILTAIDLTHAIHLVSIGASVFQYADAYAGSTITNVSFENLTNLISIGNLAFANLDIAALDLTPAINLETIGNDAFSGNSNMNSINMSGLTNLTIIGESALAYCNLSSINIPSSVTTVGAYSLIGNVLNSITVNNAITSFGDNLLNFSNDDFRTAYTADGAGTYIGTQAGTWTKQ